MTSEVAGISCKGQKWGRGLSTNRSTLQRTEPFVPLGTDTRSLARDRTRELKQENAMLSSPLTPAQVQADSAAPIPLTTVHEHSLPLSKSPTSHITSGRPRAGTMPSFHARRASPPSAASAVYRSAFDAPDFLLLPPARGAGPISLPDSGQTTPLEQPFASALLPPTSSGAALPPATHSRLRSGSLTLPSSNMSSAFGAGVFSSDAWERTPNERVGGSAESVRRNLRLSGLKPPERENSYSDDSHVRTLDYLGLADELSGGAHGSQAVSERLLPRAVGGHHDPHHQTGLSAPAAPLMQRLGSAGSIQSSPSSLGDYSAQHSRLRSNTVGTFSRTLPVGDSLLRPYVNPAYSTSATSSSSLLNSTQPTDGLYSTAAANGTVSASTGSSYPPPHHRPSTSVDSTRLLYATTGSSSAPSTSPAPSGPVGEQYQQQSTTPLVSLVPPPSNPSPTPSGASVSATASLETVPLHQRGRSATIAIVNDPAHAAEMHHRRRAGTTAGIPPHQLGIGAVTGGSSFAGGSASSGTTAVGAGPVQAMASRMSRLSISEDPVRLWRSRSQDSIT